MITAHKPFPTGGYRILSATETSTDDGIDLIAVERIINNSYPRPVLTTAEQRLAVKLLDEQGQTYLEIAERTGVVARTVARWIAAERPVAKREPQGCPSRAAYMRHRAKGEKCEPCRAANAEADRRYRRTGSTTAA